MNYIPPIRKVKRTDNLHLRKLRKIYLQQIHNSAVQSLARHNFRTTQHLRRHIHRPTLNKSRYLHLVRTVHQLRRHSIHTQVLSFSKLLFLELELRKLLTALYLEVDVVGRWKIAASYYQKLPLPLINYPVKPSLTPSHLL